MDRKSGCIGVGNIRFHVPDLTSLRFDYLVLHIDHDVQLSELLKIALADRKRGLYSAHHARIFRTRLQILHTS